jgi:hypothetical protein
MRTQATKLNKEDELLFSSLKEQLPLRQYKSDGLKSDLEITVRDQDDQAVKSPNSNIDLEDLVSQFHSKDEASHALQLTERSFAARLKATETILFTIMEK